jgi:hypothetical protein
MKQLLLCAVTIAILTLPGAAMFLMYPRASASVPVIYITPQAFDENALLPRCILRGV